jgi:hypothetical protein
MMRLPASGGDGARVGGMVSTCELSMNAVMRDKPKMLTGLNQKVVQRVRGLQVSFVMDINAVGG